MSRPTHRLRAGMAVASWLLAGLGGMASAGAADCWIEDELPKTADGIAVSDSRVAPMRALAHRIEALIRANEAFRTLPDTRLRSRWHITSGIDVPARGLWLQARDHRREMWVGACGVLQGADRWPARATVIVQVNLTGDLFDGAPEIRDEGLTAWREPPRSGDVAGHALYFGRQLVFTPSGRPPWVPVSQAEYLDFVEREISRQRAEVEANRRSALAGVSAAQAATLVATFDRALAYQDAQREVGRRFRAGLGPDRLAGAARLGSPCSSSWIPTSPGIRRTRSVRN